MNTPTSMTPTKESFFVLKASGAEVEKESFSQTAEAITSLLEKNEGVVLITGAGNQISHFYTERTGKTRDKQGPTTPEIMEHGVIPAQASIIETLQQKLPPFNLVSYDQVLCDYLDVHKRGLVGFPKHIDMDPIPGKLHVLTSVGNVDGEKVNVNGDWIVEHLAQTFQERIKELILITPTGGVLDTQEKRVPFLSPSSIETILKDAHPRISVEGGMKTKLESISAMMQQIPKIVLTTNHELSDELDTELGAGTMCMDIDKATFNGNPSQETFQELYQHQVAKKTWKPRSKENIERLRKNHILFQVKQTHLGGMSVSTKEDHPNLSMIEVVWTQERWNGNRIGEQMFEKFFANNAHKESTYALFCNKHNEAAIKLFQRCGFVQMTSDHEWYDVVASHPHGESSIPFFFSYN